VIIGLHLAARGRAQRRDRDRAGVVGVVLVRVTAGQQPHPRAHLGLHLEHPLTSAQRLLSQQMPSPPAPSMAQVRSGQAAARASSRSVCDTEARTRTSPSGSSAGLIATAVCEPLCGSTPIITAAMNRPSLNAGYDRGGHSRAT
jgi:hypothetical protein